MRQPLTGPHIWTGAEMTASDAWRRPWREAELAEIDHALAHAKAAGADWLSVDQENFPLDKTARALEAVAEELENGRGFQLLTGLPVTKFAPDDLRLVWMGLGRWLGHPVTQDFEGQMMRDIEAQPGDLGKRHDKMAAAGGGEFLSSKARTYSNGQLRFHTDRADVVGLLTVRQAASGGESRIASTAAVHNAILADRPDLLELLYQPIYRSRLGEEPGGEHIAYPLPVFGIQDGKLTSHYSRTYVEAAQLRPETPRMSDDQWAALDMLAEKATALSLAMTLAPGDIQLINSHVTYHARAAFQDDAANGQARLLHRLWLAMPNSRPLPEDHAVLWRNIAPGAVRGGVATRLPAAE